MTWKDIIKGNRNSGYNNRDGSTRTNPKTKRKRYDSSKKPYNPFTGEGDKAHEGQTEADYANNETIKERDKTIDRERRIKDSQKQVRRTDVHIGLGGGKLHSRDKSRKVRATRIDEDKIKNPDARVKCKLCGYLIGENQRFETNIKTGDVYCKDCAEFREGKPYMEILADKKRKRHSRKWSSSERNQLNN
jgi:hypothetical protein